MMNNSNLIKESLLKYQTTFESLFVPWGEGKGVWPSPPWVQFSIDNEVIPWDPMAKDGRPARTPMRRRILEK